MELDPREFIRLHAGMPEHPKVDPLSDGAFRTLIEAWCLCRRTRNDGRIPLPSWTKKWKVKFRKELIESGLVHLESDAAVMHDWLEHQPSVQALDRKREARVEAGRAGGERSGQTRRERSKPRTETEAKPEAKPEANGSGLLDHLVEQMPKQTGNGIEPELEEELEKEGGYVTGEPHLRDATSSIPPPPRCPKHIDDPNPPACGACGDARRAHEARQAADRQRRAEADTARRRADAEARALAIANCSLCDTHGYAGTLVCRHDPDQADRAQRGIALARAALDGPKTGEP